MAVERTATRFAQYWAEAVASEAADTNKDQIVTAAEAYAFASNKVEAACKAETSMATEHARREGDNVGRLTLAWLGTAALAPDNPEVAALLTQRGAIEQDLNRVKEQKASLPDTQYYDQPGEVLVRPALPGSGRSIPKSGEAYRHDDPHCRCGSCCCYRHDCATR